MITDADTAEMGGDAEAPPLAFAYHRAVAPMLWVFTALGALELFIVHLLVSIWSPTAALLLSALTVMGLVWLVLLIRSLRRLPVLVAGDALLLRTGRLLCARVPLADIAAVRGQFPSESLKERGVLSFALMSYPNVLIELRKPFRRGRRFYHRLAHCLDDPSRFIGALRGRLGEGPP